MSKGQALIRCCGSGWAGAAGPGSSRGRFPPEFRHRVRVGPGQDRPRRENLGRRRHAGRAELAAPTGRARGHQPAARLHQAAATRGDSRRRFILGHDRARRGRSRAGARTMCMCSRCTARPRQQAWIGSRLSRSQSLARTSCLGPRGRQTYHTDGSCVSFRVMDDQKGCARLSRISSVLRGG